MQCSQSSGTVGTYILSNVVLFFIVCIMDFNFMHVLYLNLLQKIIHLRIDIIPVKIRRTQPNALFPQNLSFDSNMTKVCFGFGTGRGDGGGSQSILVINRH